MVKLYNTSSTLTKAITIYSKMWQSTSHRLMDLFEYIYEHYMTHSSCLIFMSSCTCMPPLWSSRLKLLLPANHSPPFPFNRLPHRFPDETPHQELWESILGTYCSCCHKLALNLAGNLVGGRPEVGMTRMCWIFLLGRKGVCCEMALRMVFGNVVC